MVLGWVGEMRPRVSILTDGAGRSGTSRIASSEKLLSAAGAERGSVWGPVSDPAFYEAILDGDISLFVGLATKLADWLIETRPPYVAGDAREGFNPTHDLCRLIIDAAVRRAEHAGVSVSNFAFTLFAPHENCPSELRSRAIWKSLDEAGLARKVAAAKAYPELAAEAEVALTGTSRKILAQHQDLAAIVDASLDGMGERSLGAECLMPAALLPPPPGDRPFYELYGERLVAAGTYQRAIRYRDHVLPIEHALAAL